MLQVVSTEASLGAKIPPTIRASNPNSSCCRPRRSTPAADRRLRAFTVGFGTTVPDPMVCAPGAAWRRRAGRRLRFRRLPGLPAGGRTDAEGHRRPQRRLLLPGRQRRPAAGGVLGLPSQMVLQKQDVDLAFAFSAPGAAFVQLAVALSHA